MADACVFILESRDFTDTIGEAKATHPKSGGAEATHPRAASGCAPLGAPSEAEATHPTSEIRNTHINIGTGVDISIKELAETIKKIVSYKGDLYFNDTKPDGTMVKLTDPSKLHSLGWKHKVELEDGIRTMYEWYRKSNGNTQ